MNCKPGDLAIAIKARDPKNLGLLVRVIAPYSGKVDNLFGGVIWEIEGEYAGKRGIGFACDFQLRPIRDTPGEDETLQWAPVPGEKVTA